MKRASFRDDRERVAVGDDSALARHDVHHAAPDHGAYFFGGETLKDFAFALLVGIGAGAYSSIFIAAPLVAVLKEREPEYARRRDDSSLGDAGSVGGLLEEAEALAAGRTDARPDPGRVQGDGVGDGAASGWPGG